MSKVNVNRATPWQLAVLLDLTRPQVEALLQARPFSNKEEFQQSLMPHRVIADIGLDLPKRNINSGSAEELVRATGIPMESARRIVGGRPFFFIRQLRTLVGEEIYGQVESIYTVLEFEYADKITGRTIKLTANPSQVLVSKSEAEGLSSVITRWGLKPAYPQATDSVYEVFSIPETEASVDILSELQRSYGRNVIPAYRDEQSAPRYLNPKFCIVQFDTGVAKTPPEEAIAKLGLQVEARHRSAGLYTLRIPEAQADPSALLRAVRALNALPEVTFSEPNYLGFDDRDGLAQPRPFPTRSDLEGDTVLPWNLSLIHAPEAWKRSRGSPDVIIAVIDSGADMNHPALLGGFLERSPGEHWNFTSDDAPEPFDDNGHGTFISGILVGNGKQNIRGICSGCRVLPLKVPLLGEVTSYARRRDAILYALERVPPDKHLIINLSWKTSGDIALIREAIDRAAARGAIIVASAGNFPSRENEPHYPSDYPAVIAVAAVGPDQKRAYYSFFGDQVDVSAPGGNDNAPQGSIYSASPHSMVTDGVGTSFAAPHVAGVAALLASNSPSLTPSALRAAIESSASALAERGLGHGLIDAEAALRVASAAGVLQPVDALELVNSAELSMLVARFGLLTFTARLLIARRSFTQVEQIRGITGLTADQYAAITMARL